MIDVCRFKEQLHIVLYTSQVFFTTMLPRLPLIEQSLWIAETSSTAKLVGSISSTSVFPLNLDNPTPQQASQTMRPLQKNPLWRAIRTMLIRDKPAQPILSPFPRKHGQVPKTLTDFQDGIQGRWGEALRAVRLNSFH